MCQFICQLLYANILTKHQLMRRQEKKIWSIINPKLFLIIVESSFKECQWYVNGELIMCKKNHFSTIETSRPSGTFLQLILWIPPAFFKYFGNRPLMLTCDGAPPNWRVFVVIRQPFRPFPSGFGIVSSPYSELVNLEPTLSLALTPCEYTRAFYNVTAPQL